jgi:hypothetical protein
MPYEHYYVCFVLSSFNLLLLDLLFDTLECDPYLIPIKGE